MSPRTYLLAVVVVDAAAMLLVLRAAWTGVRVVMGWDPASASPAQRRLAGELETASRVARAATALMVGGALLLVVAIALIAPPLIPGAMCGAGVIEASHSALWRALVLNGLTVAALLAWRLLDGLDRVTASAPLTLTRTRLLLAATPVALLASLETASALLTLESAQPVSCCAKVYQQAWSTGQAAAAGDGSAGHLTLALFAGGAALLVVAGLWSRPASRRPWLAGVVLVGLVVWMLIAVDTLGDLLPPDDSHRCWWCLFLPDGNVVGFPLFGCLAVAALEGGAMAVSAGVARAAPELAEPARARARRAGSYMALAVFAFSAMALALALM